VDTHTYGRWPLAQSTPARILITIVGDELQTNVAWNSPERAKLASIGVMSTGWDRLVDPEKNIQSRVNESSLISAPTDISLSTSTIAESAACRSTVGLVETTDADAGDTVTPYRVGRWQRRYRTTDAYDRRWMNCKPTSLWTVAPRRATDSSDEHACDRLFDRERFTITVTEVVANSATDGYLADANNEHRSVLIGSTDRKHGEELCESHGTDAVCG